jgi:hypothetical protein
MISGNWIEDTGVKCLSGLYARNDSNCGQDMLDCTEDALKGSQAQSNLALRRPQTKQEIDAWI